MCKLYNIKSVMNIGIIGSGGREHALCKKILGLINKQNNLFSWQRRNFCLAINVDVDILILINYLN